MWNGNNGVAYADPSGYDAVSQGLDGGGGQTLFTDWSMTGMAGYDNPTFGDAMQQAKVPNVQQPVQGSSSGQHADPADQAPSKVVVAGSQVVNGGAQTDHGIPKSRGGNNTLDNANNACRNCNRGENGKHTKTATEFQPPR